VLDEVNSLTEQLRSQAATDEGWATAGCQGQQLPAAAASSVTRKMMATISELSLYQVSCYLIQGRGIGFSMGCWPLVIALCAAYATLL